MSAFGVAAFLGSAADRRGRTAAGDARASASLHTSRDLHCAPQYLAEEMLHLEGFSEVDVCQDRIQLTLFQYAQAAGQADVSTQDAPTVVASVLDARRPARRARRRCTPAAGNSSGAPRIRALRELRGHDRSPSSGVGGTSITGSCPASSPTSALDPRTDVALGAGTGVPPRRCSSVRGGQSRGVFRLSPRSRRSCARARSGRCILNTTEDRPWSQYFCCMLTARREFAQQVPGRDQAGAARVSSRRPTSARRSLSVRRSILVGQGATSRATTVALEVLKPLPYQRWRDTDPEDTLRFHASALARGGDDQVGPQEAPCAGHRLALSSMR